MRAIVLIISHKATPSTWELISLRQCVRVLGRYPIHLILPEGLNVDWYRANVPEIPIRFVDRRWLESYAMFATFKISPLPYEMYSEYEYILFYECDAFVFSDQLEHWCEQGLDYIGAPWFEGYVEPRSDRIIGIGNGGFSLRRVKSHIAIARHHQREQFLFHGYSRHYMDKLRYLRNLITHSLGLSATRPYYIGPNYYGHEDFFWCHKVPPRHPSFRIASTAQAIAFSFEAQPRLLYELNGRQLPFGCHAWFRYDLEFWRPFVEQFGHRLDGSLPPLSSGIPTAGVA